MTQHLKNDLWHRMFSGRRPLGREEVIVAVLEALVYVVTFIGVGAALWHFLKG